eukprot:gene7911-8766_t
MKFPIIVLLAAGAFSAPFSIDEFNSWASYLEGNDCSDSRLKKDVTSIFTYEGETLSTVQGSTTDQTGLKLRAKILIHPQGACKYRMQVNNPELLVKSKNQKNFQKAEESRKFSRELEAQDLVFQTSKGRLTQLFPAVGESTHVLNVKRGILSTLQLDRDAKVETDVNGRCKVNVFEQDGVVYKSKQLSDCTERAHNELGIQTATFAHSKTPIQPLNSTSTCAYTLRDEKIVSVECLESHIFRPFSAHYNRPAGAVTSVKQIVKFIGEKMGRRLDVSVDTKPSKSASLIYEHENEEMKPDNGIVTKIDNVMSALVDAEKRDNLAAKQDSAHEFTQLVTLLRKVDAKRMTPIMAKYFNCDKSGICSSSQTDLKSVYRQYILDALTYCGTPTCVSAVHDVIIDGEVTGEYMNMFLQGISLVAKPTKQMIRDVLNIASKKSTRQAYLSLGTLMRRYCGVNPDGCGFGKRNPITQAELFLEDKLGSSCGGEIEHERVEEILMAIKAIGNAGRPARTAGTLLRCAKSSLKMNITTSALEALRHMPCDNDVSSVLHGLFEDISMGSEKRIQSYLALMKCPTKSTLTNVVKQLTNEKSNQVGSFVFSHLDNIKKSSDPRHTSTQEILSSIFKSENFKDFQLPITRFSKALEGSLYSKYLKSGASVEGHVIYDSDNILPRSGLLNVTANILDVPVNMIEMAARVEGVETLMEGLFGPYGYFPEDSIMSIFNFTFTKDDIQKLRSRRSVDENIDRNVNEMHAKVNKKPSRPEGFLSMKVMGHEMRMFSYDDIMWAADEIDNMNVIELLLKVAKGGHKTFTKSVMFLEMTHTVPTAIGLPMKLKLTGSAVGSLELDGKFDIRNMFWGPSSLEVKGFVRPSAVVEVSGQMGIHSHYVDTGIFVNTSMFTSQTMKGSVVYKEGQQLRINIDAPEEPIEFFNISSTPYMFVDEKAALIRGTERRISPDFCLNSKMILGLGVCTSMAVPVAFRDYEAPYFPLSGPAHFGMRLVKADPKLTTYQFLVSVSKKSIGSGRELLGSFEIGTPGATYSRRLSGIIKYTETRKVRTLVIGSLEAKNNAELSVSYHNDTNRFEVDFSTNVITNKPIKMKLLYFNDTSFLAKEVGVLASAQYDWYKFQHVSKFVRKIESGSYLLHTKTTYWPKKHLTGEVEYAPKTKSLTVRMGANQFNQKLVMDGQFASTDTEKGLNFTVTSTMASTSMYTGIKNTESEKKFIFNTTCIRGIRHQFVWGYYKTLARHQLRFDAEIAGRTAAVYADYSNLRSGWHGLKIGASYEKNVIGLMTSYNWESKFEQQACLVAFYNDKRPAKTCLVLSEVPSTFESNAFKRLTLSVEMMKRTAAVNFDVRNTDKSYGLTSTLVYQSKELMKNTLELAYASLYDSQLKMTSTVGERSVSTRFFTTTQDELILFGVEALGFKQMVKLQGTYSKQTKAGASVYGVIFEGWVNKKLPISYTFLVESSKRSKGVSSILQFKDYSAKSSLIWIRPDLAPSEYTVVLDSSISKGDFVFFANKMTDILILGDVEKAYKYIWEFTVWNKKFKYGWDAAYENMSTESMTSYAVTAGVDYARNKRTSMKTTFSNSKELIEVNVDMNYLPGRKVSHYARYMKDAKQLDVSIEFLPRMFVKLTGRLDQTNGWKITTDLKFTWADYERSLQWIASYVKQTDIKGLNFKFTAFKKTFFVAAEYNSKTKTVIFTLTAFGRSVRLVSFWLESRGLFGMKLTTEKQEGNLIVPTEVIETVVQYSKTLLAFEMRSKDKSYVKTIAVLDKPKGEASLEMFILKKNIFKVMAEYKKSQKTVIASLYILKKQRFQATAKYNEAEKTVLVNFDALKKDWNIMFAGKWNAEKKEVTINSEFMKRVVGFSLRFDPYSYVAGVHVFYQKNIMGWTALYDPKTTSFVYNVTVTPRLSAQVVLQVIDDRIVSVTIQRKIGTEIVNEVVFKYELASSASSFILEWNKDTVQKIRDAVLPLVKSGVRNVTTLVMKVAEMSRTLSKDAVVKGTVKVLSLINNADRVFDEFDFVAAKEKACSMIVEALKKSGKMTSKALKMASNGLMKVHERMPRYMEQAVVYSKEGMALARQTFDSSVKIIKAAYGVAKNVTVSGMPVARVAFKLAREFKIRGKTTETILKDLVKMVEEIVKSYKMNLSKQLTKLKTDIEDYVKKTKVPYTEKNIEEIYKAYAAKIKAFDIEKNTRELTKKIMEYKIKELTIKEHVDALKTKLDNLPEDLKKVVFSVIKSTRLSVKKIRKLARSVESFLQPMTRCMKKIQKSVTTHFGPLVTKGNKMLMATLKKNFNEIYYPAKGSVASMVNFVKTYVLPILKPIEALYTNIKGQLLAIEVLQTSIGQHLENISGKYKKQLKEKYAEVKSTLGRYGEKMKIDKSMTAEQIAEKIIDNAVLMSRRTVDKIKKVYSERKQIYADAKSIVKCRWVKVSDYISELISRPVPEMIEKVLKASGKMSMSTMKEIASVLDQLAELDVSTQIIGTWAAQMKKAEQLGVHGKIATAIATAKRVNVTESILKIVRNARTMVINTVKKIEMKIKNYYTSVENVYKYVRSIPKKDFEEFYTELENAVLKSQTEAYELIKRLVYSMKDRVVSAKTKTVALYEEYLEKYGTPLKELYTDVKRRSMLVYDDVKDDCVYTKEFYATLVTGLAKEKYEKLRKAVLDVYDEMYGKALAFYKKHEHQTWEEIAGNVYGYGKAKYDVAYERMERLREVTKDAVEMVKIAYEKAMVVVLREKARLEKVFNEKIKPEVTRVYKKIVSELKTKGKEYYAKAVAAYEKLNAEVVKVYEANKKMSIRQLYQKVRGIAVEMRERYMEKLKTVVKEHYGKIYARSMKLKEKIEKELLPVVREEFESILNQTLRGSVIIANETIKAFTPHYEIVKEYSEKYFKDGKQLAAKYYDTAVEESKKYVDDAKTRTIKLYSKGLVEAKKRYAKVVEQVKVYMKKVKSHPKYLEIVNHELYQKIKAYIEKISEMISKKVSELKVKIEELKTHPKVEELKERINKLMKDPKVKRFLEVLKQIKTSGKFTMMKLKEKIAPVMKMIEIEAAKVPGMAVAKITFFRQYPEECFWSSVKNAKKLVAKVKSYDLKTALKELKSQTKTFLSDVTDEQTKAFVATSRKRIMEVYEKMAALPQKIKTELKQIYSKQVQMLKARWSELVAKLKTSPMYQVVSHEIWTEIAEEIKNHELVAELEALAKVALKKAVSYKKDMMATVKEFIKNRKAMIKARYDLLVKKYNNFVDETTLEDIVTKTVEIYGKMMAQKEKVMKKLNAVYSDVKSKATVYKDKAVEFAKVRYTIVKKMWNDRYPKIVAQFKTAYKKYLVEVDAALKKFIAYLDATRARYIAQAKKMWDESIVKQKLTTFKGMTVKETVAVVKEMPDRVKAVYQRAVKTLTTEYNRFVKPHLTKVVAVARIIGNEINETAVFVYNYYHVKENALRMYNKTYNHIRNFMPLVPTMTKDYLKMIAKMPVKGLHATLVYVDNLELKPYIAKMKEMVPDLKKYASIESDAGRVVIRINHPRDIEPRFSYHVENVKGKISEIANKVKCKTAKITKSLLDDLKARTTELRKDLNTSLLAHSRLVEHLKSRSIALKENGVKQSTILKTYLSGIMNETKLLADITLTEVKYYSKALYNFTTTAVTSIANSDSIAEAYEKAYNLYADQMRRNIRPMYDVSKIIARNMMADVKKSYDKALNKTKTYLVMVKSAAQQWRSGKQFRVAFYEVESELKSVYGYLEKAINEVYAATRRTVKTALADEDVEAVMEYLRTHKDILGKYGKRLNRLYTWNKVALDRAVSRAKMLLRYRVVQPIMRKINPLRTYAMIFGKSHVMTFDGKSYEFVNYAKTECTYLLARDFKNGNFTILSTKEAIIVKTPDMNIRVHSSGRVSGTVVERKFNVAKLRVVKDLPIDTENGYCKIFMGIIKCTFKQGIVLQCSIDYFFCSVELSAWHYGKSQGLLGTNNNELYDEFKTPENTLASTVTDFANSWLVSKDSQCRTGQFGNEAPTCNKSPSNRCFELFKKTTSPFAGYFTTVDALPFLKACLIDTADCDSNEPVETSHCNATAAYRRFLFLKGRSPPRIPECGPKPAVKISKPVTRGNTWTQKPTKEIDVVVLVSARSSASKFRRSIASMLYSTNKKFVKMGYNTRYALVSYGTGSQSSYDSRSHTHDGEYFSDEKDIATAIKTMAYTGADTDRNDYYAAILRGAGMAFRPGATKLFFLFNFGEYKSSWFGPTFDETQFALKYKANASLFVFDDFQFKSVEDTQVLGETINHVYLKPFQPVDRTRELPVNAFTKLVRHDGGMFSNNLRPAETKGLTSALSHAAKIYAERNMKSCQTCAIKRHRVVCRSDITVKC